MQAIIKKEYSKGFLLNEEHLIKLNDICSKRFDELNLDQELSYKVYRSDSLVYESTSYQSVLDEENSKRNKIEKVRITSESGVLKYALSFDYDEGVSLSVEAQSKDKAYLLFSDVKDYLITEILCFRSFSFDKALSSRNTFPVVMVLSLLFMTYLIGLGQIGAEELNTLVQTGTVEEKINHLLVARNQRDSPDAMYPMFGMMLIVMVVIFGLGSFLDRVFPRNIFCWGKMAGNHTRLVSLRSKILWGIIIAFMISVAAALFLKFVGMN